MGENTLALETIKTVKTGLVAYLKRCSYVPAFWRSIWLKCTDLEVDLKGGEPHLFRIVRHLRASDTSLTARQIAINARIPLGSVRVTINRHRNLFVNTYGGGWWYMP